MMLRRVLVLAAVFVLADAFSAMAQQQPVDESHLVWNATGSAALQTRRPGMLIDNGVVRHSDAQARAFGRPEITEPADTTLGLRAQLQVVALEALFQNLNTMLLAFDNLIRVQAGFAPYIGVPITPGLPAGLP